jgi:predicted transcriptional regulator
VTPSPDHTPREARTSIRMDAGLDKMTREKLEDLARAFHQSRAAVLRHVMRWGLTRVKTGTVDQHDLHGPVCHIFITIERELHEQVHEAAMGAGGNVTPWLRHLMLQVAVSDFPASWQTAAREPTRTGQSLRTARRSHDSRDYDTGFMFRLDEAARAKLQDLVEYFAVSRADIIRQLIAQATPEDFPRSWRMKTQERRSQEIRRPGARTNQKPRKARGQ